MRMEPKEVGIPFYSRVCVHVAYEISTMLFRIRADIPVANVVILEIEAVAALMQAHEG